MPLFFGDSIGSATASDLCNYSSLSSHGYNIHALGSGFSIRPFICLLCQLARNWWEEKTRGEDFKLSNMTPLVVFFLHQLKQLLFLSILCLTQYYVVCQVTKGTLDLTSFSPFKRSSLSMPHLSQSLLTHSLR